MDVIFYTIVVILASTTTLRTLFDSHTSNAAWVAVAVMFVAATVASLIIAGYVPF